MKKMIIENISDLAKDALDNPGKFNGFMGVSLLHRFYSKENMSNYFTWCSKRFNKFTLVLMDDPDRYNFIVFKKINVREGLALARKISDEIKSGYNKLLLDMKIDNVEIMQFRDFISSNEYKLIFSEIEKYIEMNPNFKDDLVRLMNNGIGGKIEKLSKQITTEEFENAKHILFQYIVEEIAAIIYFTENGYPIEIDPSIEFSTKKRIYEADFTGLYSKLKLTKRGHIFIHPQGLIKTERKMLSR
jgi:tRNA-dependent cyclodipeptide synthase